MKLVFPGGEHPQVLLGEGVNRVGSDPQSTIVINHPGVMPLHCQLHVTATGVTLDVPAGAAVTVNGRPVAGLIALRKGDAVGFDAVQARLAPVDAVSGASSRVNGLPPAANDSAGVTTVRAALPKYVLRTVSGVGFGRNYPIAATAVIGRAPECSIRLDESGISRMHARLMPTEDGVQLEDLGSTNGSFINGKRVLFGEAKVGDEIAFDTARFRLAASATAEPFLSDGRPDGSEKPTRSRGRMLLIAGVVGALALAAAAASGLL